MKMITEGDVQTLIAEMREEFPSLQIHEKKPWWLQITFRLPGFRRLGWENSTQTIGSSIYLSAEWDRYSQWLRWSILRHEREHLRQFRDYTPLVMAILYLFVPFPIFLAYFRAKFERAGFKESLRARVEVFGATAKIRDEMLDRYLEVFTGWGYLKMWPFLKTVRKWFSQDFKTVILDLHAK